jgi:uncharacterized protein YeeX (DUF496 family)
MILHKLSMQRVKRCTKVREDFSERSRRLRDNSRRIITVLPGLSDSPE